MKFNTLVSTSLFVGFVKFAQCLSGRGDMTFYSLSPDGHGACGRGIDFDTYYYVSVNEHDFDSTKSSSSSSSASICGKCIQIISEDKYFVGRVVDRCAGCKNGSVDVSPKMFGKINDVDNGRVTVNWKMLDSCSSFGKYGTCSGSDCSISSQKTTTTTTTTTLAPTPTINPMTPNNSTTTLNNTHVINNGNTQNGKQVPINGEQKKNNNNKSNINGNEEEEEDSSSSAAFIITGAVAVTGAAGVGLLIVSKKSGNYEEIKQKFPEAFSNLKRSITRGSSNLRRGLSRSGTKLKRKLTGKRANASARGKSLKATETRIKRNSYIDDFKIPEIPSSSSLEIDFDSFTTSDNNSPMEQTKPTPAFKVVTFNDNYD